MSQSLHYDRILTALRHLAQSRVALTADTSGAATVLVGSNRLFTPGAAVVLTDAAGNSEAHTVQGCEGLHEVLLDAPVQGEFTVAAEATLGLDPPRLADLRWVGQGLPPALPAPPATQLPAVIVLPGRMEQRPGEGTNRLARQDYRCLVYYLQRPQPGEAACSALLAEVEKLFELLSADPYLGGAAWHAQVTRVEPDAAPLRRLRDAGQELIGAEIEVLAKRMGG